MKAIFLVLISFLFVCALSAQNKPQFGVKAGLNVSSVNWDFDPGSRLGVYAGGLAHIHLNKQWAIQPEVVYSQEGAKGDLNDVEYVWKNDYINVPVMVQYMFDNGFRIEAGPQVGFLVNSKTKNNNTEVETKNDDNAFQTVNVSVGLGLNYLTYSGIGVGARYNLGLTKVNEDGIPDGKGRVFQVGLFYLFKNNHKAASK
jgi:hypothetical protein